MIPKTGVELIAEERQEQIKKHGFDVHNDSLYENEELIDAALFAITGDDKYYPNAWGEWWRNIMVAKTASTHHSKIERLKIAGALLAAEIDRLLFVKARHEEWILTLKNKKMNKNVERQNDSFWLFYDERPEVSGWYDTKDSGDERNTLWWDSETKKWYKNSKLDERYHCFISYWRYIT